VGRTSGVPPSSRGGGGMPSYVVGGPACQPTALRFGVSLGFASVTRHPRPHSGILSPSVTGGDAVTVMWGLFRRSLWDRNKPLDIRCRM